LGLTCADTTIYIPVQILLHGPNDTPMMIQRGLKVTPGHTTVIAVSVTEVCGTGFEISHLCCVGSTRHCQDVWL